MAGIFQHGGREGIFGGRRARREAAAAAQERRETLEGLDFDSILDSSSDPGTAAAYRSELDNYRELALSSDEDQQTAGLQGLMRLGGEMNAARERRLGNQRTFVIDQARELQGRYERANAPRQEVQERAEQLASLLSDPEYEQNKAINRGFLIDLVDSTTRQLLSDPADMSDALMRAGAGGGLLGALGQIIGGTLKAEDYNFLKEDYATLARAQYLAADRRYQQTIEPLEIEAAQLEQGAAQLDFLPPGYSLTQFVTGGGLEFENPFADNYPEGANTATVTPQVPPLEQLGDTANELIDTVGDMLSGRGGTPTPEETAAAPSLPKFGGVMSSQVGIGSRAFGYDESVRSLNVKLQELQAAGADIRGDPQTGHVWAIHKDGTQERLPTTTLQRDYVREGYTAGRRQSVGGAIDRSKQR